MVRLDI